VAAVGCGGRGEFRPLQVGDAAPPYSARTMGGDTVTLAGFHGRAVLLDVWATWCMPCRTEMPALQRLYAAFADSGLTVVAVSVDGGGSDGNVREYMRRYGIQFTVARDPEQRVARTFRTVGVPETFLIDRTGKIAVRWIGEFDPMSARVRTAVRAATNP